MIRKSYTVGLATFVGVFMFGLMASSALAINLRDWGDQLPNGKSRFQVLKEFNNEAVLDKETQLVWEQSPAITQHTQFDARFQCTSRTTGGRKGWRLPSVHELASLADPSVLPPGPVLSPGHPFTNVQTSIGYWSATTSAEDSTSAWFENFGDGHSNTFSKAGSGAVWCARGPMNADAY
jgi:hypothetical protein